MLATAVAATWLAGCAGPGPRLFPVAPVETRALSDGGLERRYDTNGDGRADRAEVLDAGGMVRALRYDAAGDGTLADRVELADIPADQRRQLILILDSIPFAMVRDTWQQGRLRLFYPPSRVLSPFPVMTDPVLGEFFGAAPCPGVEAAYFDGQKLRNGYEVYAADGNVPWQARADYRLKSIAHPFAYLWPRGWYGHELRYIQDGFGHDDKRAFIGYVVGTSALGASSGRDGHQIGLIQLDRFCQQMMFENRGRVQITLLSDHGHNLVRSRRIPLSELLTDFGYHVGGSLKRPGDVVVPEFGMVTCAVIHTREPERVARDVVGIEGVELAAYCDTGGANGDCPYFMVLSRDGQARITRSDAGFRYQTECGDPLQLKPVLDELARKGRVNAEGFVNDGVLFEATTDHLYPDAVYRLWRAFHGLIEHTPDVMLSIDDGYHCGSAFITDCIELAAAHGSLRSTSSTAFVMTTAGELPPVVRMEGLRQALSELGVRVVEDKPM